MSKTKKIVLNITRVVLFFVGMFVGYLLSDVLYDLVQSISHIKIELPVFIGVTMALFGLIGLIIAQPLANGVIAGTKWVEQWLKQLPFTTLVSSTLGLIVGLLVAMLLSSAVSKLPLIGAYMPIIISIIFGYLGASLGYRWEETIESFMNAFRRSNRRNKKENKEIKNTPDTPNMLTFKTIVRPKVLDTSVIIDGRIIEICKSGFLEGPLVITNFVLDELRHIADSSDSLKRTRGRRGLDILNELQNLDIEILNVNLTYDDIPEVDAKLVNLAKDCNGYVVTNDFNLNKVASFQKVTTLNVNELAGAIKTVVLPGETMHVEVVARGKENDQGVGYLDDGTMIVVENGKHAIGQIVDTVVTSVIQTNAGRMIFVRIAN